MEPFGTDVVPADGDATSGEEERWRDVPPSWRPGSALPKWPFVMAGLMLFLTVAIFVFWRIEISYLALSPGPVSDVGDHVVIEGGAEEDDGELFFLTVSVSSKEVTALEALAAWLDPQVDLTRVENIRPAGVSPEQLRRQNLDSMRVAQDTAKVVAIERLGYEVTFRGGGAVVSSVMEDGPAAEILEANDVIIAVNGASVEFLDDAIAELSGFMPGETVTLSIRRPTDEAATVFDELEIDVTLGVFVGEDDEGNPVIEEDRGMVGVLLGNFDLETVLPFDIDIDTQNVGGPSAGMMFTLEIINQLGEDDLTKGHIIAGTGTIARDGSVGPIGGVRQKVYAAIAAGAEYVLTPAGNYDDALAAADDDIEVVRIETIDQALAFFDTL